MAPKQPFLLPVVIDDTPQSDDAIPDRFRELQWSRLPGGHATPTFVERARRLLLLESNAPTATPALVQAHLALAAVFDTGDLDFVRASEEYERAAALAPGNASVLRDYGRFAVWMGRAEFGIATARRAVVVDPLNAISHSHLGQALFLARRYNEAIAAYQDYQALDSGDAAAYSGSGLAHYVLGDFQGARTSCETKPDYWESQLCLAVTYDKLARRPDAEAVLAKLRAVYGDASAYQYAEVYAQWGDRSKALEWLDTAMRLRDPGLVQLKSDPLLDPLRKEPRFQAIERELKFPS